MPRVKKYKQNVGKNRQGFYPTAKQQAKMGQDRKRHQQKVAKKAFATRFLRG